MFVDGAPFGEFDGVEKYKTATSGALGGTETASLAVPADGELWVVLQASGFHDDDNGTLVCYWSFWDGASGEGLSRDGNAQLVFSQLYSKLGFTRPLVLHYGQRLDYIVDGTTAGHLVKIRAIVAVIRGVEPWVNT